MVKKNDKNYLHIIYLPCSSPWDMAGNTLTEIFSATAEITQR